MAQALLGEIVERDGGENLVADLSSECRDFAVEVGDVAATRRDDEREAKAGVGAFVWRSRCRDLCAG